MLVHVKGAIDPSHYGIVLASDLINEDGDFYSLTLKQAFDELAKDSSYVCAYQVARQMNCGKWTDSYCLTYFTAWTKDLVIFNQDGPFVQDKLLISVPRNPT